MKYERKGGMGLLGFHSVPQPMQHSTVGVPLEAWARHSFKPVYCYCSRGASATWLPVVLEVMISSFHDCVDELGIKFQ